MCQNERYRKIHFLRLKADPGEFKSSQKVLAIKVAIWVTEAAVNSNVDDMWADTTQARVWLSSEQWISTSVQ